MKIVKLLVIIICFVLFEKTNAQTYLVGDTGCNYVPLHHVVNPYMGQIPSTTSYSIDVDGDLSNDIVFNWASQGSSVGSSAYSKCRLTCSSPSNYEFVFQQTASGCLSPSVTLPANLLLYTSLNQNLNWNANVPNSYIYDYNMPQYFAGYHCGYYLQNSVTNVYIGFRKVLTNDTIYGWLFLKTHVSAPVTSIGSDEIVSYGFKHTLNSSSITPVFTNTATSICMGTSLPLTASPSGGAFFGPGVTGNTFNSTNTPPGTYTVYYSKNCSATALTLLVNPLPTVAFTNTFTSLCNGDSLVLAATPSGGIFGGLGVSGNTFHSSITGLGITPVNYFYTGSNGCSNTTTLNLNVVTVPNLSISSTSSISCSAQPVTLTATGASNYTWSTGSTNQSIVVMPTAFTVYSVSGSFASGNCPAGTTSFSLATDNNPTVTITGPNGPFCQYPTECATLTANGAANYLWLPSSTYSSTVYCPNVTTTFTLVGTNANGCKDTAYHTLNVLVPPMISVTPSSVGICQGDTAKFSFTGGTGIFELYTGGGFLVMPVSPPSFYLTYLNYSYTGTNFFELHNYYSTVKPNCYALANLSIRTVCVGIEEHDTNNRDHLKIFPNPNSGEFEIMGVSEETIYISNELGQLITTKNLNEENNFSAKLNGLNGGIYFVGNKFAKQKIVVIK
ncbi:MAG: T9SS type A sorting domain-containing protein [Bacteroidia bacterium]|nr:T9SS type A sorting domain-containing protein [Bacteroidia bacterium]